MTAAFITMGPPVILLETAIGLSPARPRRVGLQFGAAGVCMCLGAVGIFMRLWHVDWLPGLNGDEAWYGAVARHIVSGQSFPVITPTGNVIDPFFVVPQVLLASVLGPSIAALRSVSIAAGLATIIAAMLAVRSVTRDRAAWIAAGLVIACLPVTIAYSRFAWDASLSVGAGLFVLWAAAEWSNAAVGLALLAAIIVHPTNMLLVPAATLFSLLRDRPVRELALRVAVMALVAATMLATSHAVSNVHQGQINPLRLFDIAAWNHLGSCFASLVFVPRIYYYIDGGTGAGWGST
jgi:4-amino-4-deoxy-L-arabinose transferase-like glycosyltransferase